MIKEAKEGITTMPHQIENTNKEIENIKKNQVEILELKNTIIEMKNSEKGLNSLTDIKKNQ